MNHYIPIKVKVPDDSSSEHIYKKAIAILNVILPYYIDHYFFVPNMEEQERTLTIHLHATFKYAKNSRLIEEIKRLIEEALDIELQLTLSKKP